MIVVDTTVWIDFLNGYDSAQRKLLHKLIEKKEDLTITEIILTEVLQGISSDKHFRKVREYLKSFEILKPRGDETYIRAAEIYRRCRKKGKTIRSTVDLIIAAVTMEAKAYLLHKDSDFNLIKECTNLKTFP